MNKATIGAKIREARLRLGLTQAEFSQRINCSPQVLSSYERGVYLPDIFLLEAVVSTSPGMTLEDFRDNKKVVSKLTASSVNYENITDAERQLIEKVRSLRRDRRRAVYILFGIRDESEDK